MPFYDFVNFLFLFLVQPVSSRFAFKMLFLFPLAEIVFIHFIYLFILYIMHVECVKRKYTRYTWTHNTYDQ